MEGEDNKIKDKRQKTKKMTTTKTYTLPQVLISWIINNNPSAVKAVLISNGLIASGSNPSKAQMERALNNYSISNGKTAVLSLLKQIPVNINTSAKQKQALANSYQEILSANSGNSQAVYQSPSRVADQSANKWWNDVIDVVLGSESSTVDPIVKTTTSTSPLVIGALIAGVLLVLGLAYFLIKR